MISPVAIWPSVAGAACLAAGLAAGRWRWAANREDTRLFALASACYAAPLAVFGTEHLCVARSIMQGVPAWIPWHLFWAYFVGVALIAAAVSIVARRSVQWSGSLLAGMILFFVLAIHLPNLAKDPGNRMLWAVAVRDTAFAATGLILAANSMPKRGSRGSRNLILMARLVIAVAVFFFGTEQLLHPEFAPGVPLEKITPAWFPLARLWGYLAGTVLLIAGPAMLLRRFTRIAAAWVGGLMVVLTVFLYLPILLNAAQTDGIVEGVNYVADTLMFGGTALLLAAAWPRESTGVATESVRSAA